MPLPIITVAQMREWENLTWASGQSEEAVMRQAGHAVARVAEQLTAPSDRVLVLAGKGHNGDDACYAAEDLRGRETTVIRVKDPEASLSELESMLQPRPALIIDGLFGIGLNRPLNPSWTRFINRLNQARLPVLAVDVPSGLNADSGETQGTAVLAAHTLTLGTVKAGLIKPSSWNVTGRLHVASDIGLVPCPHQAKLQWTVPADFQNLFGTRPVSGHKGSFGHLVILAGSLGYHGAAVLTARGAQRAQPGLVTLITPEPTYLPVASQLQAVMVRPWSSHFSLPESATAIAVGPGLAAEDLPATLRETVIRLWRESLLPMVVDASALAWLPPQSQPHAPPRVLTPHPGEAARLLGVPTSDLLRDRPDALRKISHKFGDCFVVLKGHQTLVGRSSEDTFLNGSGNPYLAQGGSGDLLTGFLGGLLAQPPLLQDLSLLLRYGVWEHGAAADQLQRARAGWTIEDLAETIGGVLPGAAPPNPGSLHSQR